MKKLIPLILALLLLAACGAETPPAESVEPSSPYNLVTPPPQTPPAEPSDETLSRELPEGFALPQEEFEPAAYYLAEPFGEQGAALLTLSADGRFTCRYGYWRQDPENGSYNLLGGSLADVLASFPEQSSVRTSEPEKYRHIYGGDIGLLGTYDAMDEGRGGKCVSVSDGWTITRFIFDENDEVYKIEFWNSVD